MKSVLILIFIALLNPLFAQEIDLEEKYIVTGEQILQWQRQIQGMQQYINNLTYALNEKEMEVTILKSEAEKWKYKYEQSRKGFWTGLSSGYPLGAQGIILYQFNERIGMFMVGGYSSVWTINAGFIARISK